MARIQSISAFNDAASGSPNQITASFGSGVGSGNLVVVQVCHLGTTDLVTGVTIGSDALTKVKFIAGQNVSMSVWAGLTTAAGATLLTASYTGSGTTFRKIAAVEVSGYGTFDVANATRVSPTPATSGNITTAAADYCFAGMVIDQGGDEALAAGVNEAWTIAESYGHTTNAAGTEDFIQSAAGTTHATFTETPNGSLNALCFIAAFLPAAPPPSVVPSTRQTPGSRDYFSW